MLYLIHHSTAADAEHDSAYLELAQKGIIDLDMLCHSSFSHFTDADILQAGEKEGGHGTEGTLDIRQRLLLCHH